MKTCSDELLARVAEQLTQVVTLTSGHLRKRAKLEKKEVAPVETALLPLTKPANSLSSEVSDFSQKILNLKRFFEVSIRPCINCPLFGVGVR